MKLVRTMIVGVYCRGMKRGKQEYIGLNGQDLKFNGYNQKKLKQLFHWI